MSAAGRPPKGGAAERTALAWSRTILALAAVIAFISVHAALMNGASIVAVVGTGLAVILAASSSLASRRIWTGAQNAVAGEARAVRPVALAALAATVSVVAAIALSTIAGTYLR